MSNKIMNDYAKQAEILRNRTHVRWQSIEDKINYKESSQANQALKEKLFYIDEEFEPTDMDIGNKLYD